ncbi:MAG: hypothetical protein AAFO07_33530 [Bacteroidota bacterium]
MHDIEPFYKWRDRYVASSDARSPFFGRTYDEFYFTNKVYNYFVHPQWDEFGSPTLYMKLLYTDYDEGFAIIELIGEWNDAIGNDIMFLKRDVADVLYESGIYKYILICENVLNFHGSDDCYYEEWSEEVQEEFGWICILNTLQHVEEEMRDTQLNMHIKFGGNYNNIIWRPHKPKVIYQMIEQIIHEENSHYLTAG